MSEPFSPEELTEEKNLWQIYRKARGIPSSWFNQLTTVAIFLMLVIYAIMIPSPKSAMADRMRILCDIGFSFATQILGFLLTGFAVFATVSKPEFLKVMARIDHKESGLSYLKYSFFSFMNVFVVFLAFTAFIISVKLFAGPGGLLSILISRFFFGNPVIKHSLACVGMVIVGTWLFYLLLLLKSFVFNVYHIIMASIRWEFIEEISLQNASRIKNEGIIESPEK